MAKRIAIFGGSFNPPHLGHVLAATYASRACNFDAVLVVPTFEHPFAKQLVEFQARLQMCRLAFEGIAGVEVSDIESRLKRPSVTLQTVQHLQEANRDAELRLLLGSDLCEETSRWHQFDAVRAIARPLWLHRGSRRALPMGEEALPLVLPTISSTEIREALTTPGARSALAGHVGEPVAQYIVTHQLYGDL